jgi:hypothetical protein
MVKPWSRESFSPDYGAASRIGPYGGDSTVVERLHALFRVERSVERAPLADELEGLSFKSAGLGCWEPSALTNSGRFACAIYHCLSDGR